MDHCNLWKIIFQIYTLERCSSLETRTDESKSSHHACIGLHVARKEGEVAINEILSRFPSYEVDESGLETYATEFVKGYSAMPVRFKP